MKKYPTKDYIKQKTATLLNEYQKAPDHRRREIEEEVFVLNRPLIFKALKMVGVPSRIFEDFIQEASHGMLKAIRKYDPKAAAFSTYAMNTMKGVIKNGYRDNEWTLTVPRTEKERGVQVSKIAHNHQKMKELKEDNRDIEYMLALINAQHPMELTNDYISNMSNGDKLEDDIDNLETKELVDDIMSYCDPDEAWLIDMHFVRGFSPEELSIITMREANKVREQIEYAVKKCHQLLSNKEDR